jgi:hybrid cluster-associated redox disulfide protein
MNKEGAMPLTALVVAVVALFVGYLAVRRVSTLDRRLSQVVGEVEQVRAELSAAREKLEAQLQNIHVDAMKESGTLAFLPNMTIAEAMALHPGVGEILTKFSLNGCSSCAISDVDTLEGACRSYGIDQRALMTALSHLLESTPTDLVQMAQARERMPRN